MSRYIKTIGFYILLFIVIWSIWTMVGIQSTQDKMVYSDLVNYIEAGQVKQMVLTDTEATIVLNDDSKYTIEIPSSYVLYEDVGAQINENISKGKLTLKAEHDNGSWWVSLIPALILILIFGGLMFVLFQQSQGGGGGGRMMSFGKSKARVISDDKKKTTFKDVAGADEEKEELEEVVDFLKDPRRFLEIGARIPKGILLVGPPGTGKTLLAKAVAGEAGVPFFSISGSDFVEMFVGVGASRVRDLFEQAKKNSPSIVFIDEIDAVGRQRGAGLGGGHDEREQTLNQLLVEMDGFSVNEGVIIIAATNRPDILDPALLRPGRFDRQVVVGRPDVKGREEILKIHSRGKFLGDDIDLSVLAKTTIGFTGADLENLMNEAALLAGRAGKKVINMPELKEAMLKVTMGPEKRSHVRTERVNRLTAYHEGGHALTAYLLPLVDRVHQISIIPRGRAGGFTMTLPSDEKDYRTKEEMLQDIVMTMGGRAAEKLVLEDISTGASGDIQHATAIAREMIVTYGMSERLGPIAYKSSQDEVFIGRDFGHSKTYSEHVAAEIDEEIKNIVEDCYQKALDLLETHIDTLHLIARELLEKETLDSEDFEAIFGDGYNKEKPADGVDVASTDVTSDTKET